MPLVTRKQSRRHASLNDGFKDVVWTDEWSESHRWFCCRKKRKAIIIIIIIIGASLSEPHTRELVENFLYSVCTCKHSLVLM